MGVCAKCNPPWVSRDEDNFCSGCRRPLRNFDVATKLLSIVVDENDLGTGTLVLSNTASADIDPVNSVTVRFHGSDLGSVFSLRDEQEIELREESELHVDPGQEARVVCTVQELPPGGEYYGSVTLDTNDPRAERAEVRLGISHDPPEIEWLDAQSQVISGQHVLSFQLLGGQGFDLFRLTKSLGFRNRGGGYLAIETFEPAPDRRRWFEVGKLPAYPLKRSEKADIEITLLPEQLPPGAGQQEVPFSVRLSNGSELTVYVEVVVSPPAQLEVEMLPPFRREPDGSFLLENCTPYARRDFEVQLSNIGGEPLTIVGLEAAPVQALRWYRGGVSRLDFGEFPPVRQMRLGPNSGPMYHSLSIDLPRLTPGQNHSFALQFRTDPPSAAQVCRLTLKVNLRPFDPTHEPHFIGIDFGTSSSTVAVRQDQLGEHGARNFEVVGIEEQRALELDRDRRDLPSIILFRELDDPLIGSLAEALSGDGPADRYLRSFKRTIGLHCPRRILNRDFLPEDLAEIIFTKLIAQAAQNLEYFTSRIVATCPANFGVHQRQSTLRACHRALLRIMLDLHGDQLRVNVGKIAALITTEIERSLQDSPEGRAFLTEISAAANCAQRDRFAWDPSKAPDAILLLTYFVANRSELIPSEARPGTIVARSEPESCAILREVTRSLLSPVSEHGYVRFSVSPDVALSPHVGESLAEVVDVVETLLVETLTSWRQLEVILLEEPTAAAYAYLQRNKGRYREMVPEKREYIAVYDFGGGTFDITVAGISRSQGGVLRVEVIRSDGINEMGGDDLDFALIDNYLRAIRLEERHFELLETSINELDEAIKRVGGNAGSITGLAAAVRDGKRQLKRRCEGDKIFFSTKNPDKVEQTVGFLGPIKIDGDPKVVLDRARFESLIRDRIRRTVMKFKEVVRKAQEVERQAGRDFAQLDRVVLVGKTSRLPMVRELLESDPELGLGNRNDGVFDESMRGDEKVCVAVGAAYYGHWRAEQRGRASVEVSSRVLTQSIGVLGNDGVSATFDPVKGLEKGAPIGEYLEASLSVPYRLVDWYEILQSHGVHDRPVAFESKEMTYLGTFGWQKPLKDARPDEQVLIIFRVDANGIVTVSGSLRNEAVGYFRPIPPKLRDKPGFMFI